MREKLLEILIELRETDSWDLAKELAIWIYNNERLSNSCYNSILNFLNIALKLTNEIEKQENIKKSITRLEILKKREAKDKENENLELLIEQFI